VDILIDNFLCAESEGLLSGSPLYTDYTWVGPDGFTSTESSIKINTPGTYELILYQGTNCEARNSVEVEISPDPNPAFVGSLSYCPGGTPWMEIIPEPGLSWVWQDGSQDVYYEGQEQSEVSIVATNQFGCSKSFTFVSVESDHLEPAVYGDRTFCSGSEAMLYAGQGYQSYQWNGKEEGAFFESYVGTSILLEVTDVHGCSGTIQTILTELPLPTPSGARIGASDQGNNGSILLYFPSFAFISYDIQWSNGMSGAKITQLSPGIYDVTITDSQGCTVVLSFEVGTQQGFNQQGSKTAYHIENNVESVQLQVFPNPGKDQLFIRSADKVMQQCTLMDLQGTPLFQFISESMTNEFQMRISPDIKPGMYILLIKLDNGQTVPLQWIKG
jgi:hypothetical protein